MIPFAQPQQKIIVRCLVEQEGQLLLWRGSQLDAAIYRESVGYFGLPSFELTYGVSPKELITRVLAEQLHHTPTTIQVLDVMERMLDPTTQAIDLLYRATLTGEVPAVIGTSRYFFARPEMLERYVFPDELSLIKRWISS